MKQVAQVLAAQSSLGVKRQIFFCSYGFDTHGDQLVQHVPLLTEVSQSMSAFYQATQEHGVTRQVTTFLDFVAWAAAPGSSDVWGARPL